jgi:hypothetical protein
MSNFGVKRAKHRAWPQPTKPVDRAVVIVGASKPTPTKRQAPKAQLTSPVAYGASP